MARPLSESVFLARDSFRRRRMRDAGRALPILTIVLITLPLLKSGEARLSAMLIYLFGLWFVVVVIAAILSRLARDPVTDSPEDEDTAP